MEVHLERQNGWLVVDGQPVTNFYLKVVGECAPADDDVVRWIVEVEGRVLGQRKRRYILMRQEISADILKIFYTSVE
jgi:hypothetical protein